MIRILLFLLLAGCQDGKYENVGYYTYPTTHYNKTNLEKYLVSEFRNIDHEELKVVYLTSDDEIIDIATFAVGDQHHVKYNLILLYAESVKRGAKKIILAHNHPNQYWAIPSTADKRALEELRPLYQQFGLEIKGSLVVGAADVTWILDEN